MQDLLYLVHRMPYPPNKGDKIRSYHLLRHLSQRYRIHLGTFIDDEQDWDYVERVKKLCVETCFVKLNPLRAKIWSLSGLASNSALSLPYYKDTTLQMWVNRTLDTHPINNILAFSSPMTQYVNKAGSARRVIDFVDVDSDKWRQYALTKPWPLSWLYRRESRLLLNYERQVAEDFDHSTFVSEAEAALFKQLVPSAGAKVTYFNNGVDADYFSPQKTYENPYPEGTQVLVFTGAMDYWANVDAVDWFAREIFPAIQAVMPLVQFYIVGSRPTAQVMELAHLPGITVTGSVPDVRPFLAHAALSVAPLRIARGIQNKILEAMAMEKIVVASPQAMEGISAVLGQELFVASNERDYANRILSLLKSGTTQHIGRAARIRVLEDYSWDSSLNRLEALLYAPQVKDKAA